MSTVILHLGMDKTGSSSIQRYLAELPATPAFSYADLKRVNQSMMLVGAFMSEPEQYGRFVQLGLTSRQARARSSKYRTLIERAVGADAADTVVFSGEGVLSLAEPELLDLHRTLAGERNEVRAVGYVRAPHSYIESKFQQRIKMHGAKFNLRPLYPRYRRRLEKFDRVFGERQVSLWAFEPERFAQSDVVHDFCARIGAEPPAGGTKRFNDALSRQACALLYTYRKFGPPYGSGRKAVVDNGLLIARLGQLKGDKLRLSSDLVAPLLRQNASDIAWMEERLGRPFAAHAPQDEAGAVQGEDDLLRFEEETLLWLADALGPAYRARCRAGMKPELVAEWVHSLRISLAEAHAAQRG